MSEVHAYGAAAAGAELVPMQYEPGALGADEVDVAVEHCGICHSDLSMLNDEWEMTQFPFVPGHEVVGTVTATGDAVTQLKVGQRVGLGWHAGFCGSCSFCMSGDHNLCLEAQPTIVGRHGGFADRVRARESAVIPLPEALDPVTAGPLLCGGIAVFNPLVQFDVKPTDEVAVVGIGGLGHLALQFARAWGCRVTAFTSEGKREEALGLGAHETIDSRDPEAIAAAAGRFNLILSTVNVKQDWNAYLGALKPKGRLHVLGVVTEALDLDVTPMLFGQYSVSSSPVGSPETIRKMLDFAARHGITTQVEQFPLSQVNEALTHLENGKARYRIVLSR